MKKEKTKIDVQAGIAEVAAHLHIMVLKEEG